MKKYILPFIFISISLANNLLSQDLPYFQNEHMQWAKQQLQKMTLKEKIAQLIVLPLAPDEAHFEIEKVEQAIKKYKVGGVIIFHTSSPTYYAQIVNRLQKTSPNIPLFIAIDGEWGVSMRIDQTIKYPYQMTLGAIQDDSLIYQMGKHIAYDLKTLGTQTNFSPVIDVNNNPKNPVIGYRSFSDDKHIVTQKALMYMKGLQDGGTLAVAKHFPGHGDTHVDSHLDLPTLAFSKERLDSLELYPYKKLIAEGLGGVMVGHLHVPSWDNTPQLASSLSYPIITQLLKEELNFKGLIVSDAMRMKGVATYFPQPGKANLLSLKAGMDVLECISNVKATMKETLNAVKRKEISEQEIDEKCLKMLAYKSYLQLKGKISPINTTSLNKRLNRPEAQLLNKQLYEKSITLLRNDNDDIPLKETDKYKIATLAIGESDKTIFQTTLDKYGNDISHFMLPLNLDSFYIPILKKELEKYDKIITGVFIPSKKVKNNFGITSNMQDMVNFLSLKENTSFLFFGNPYALSFFKNIHQSKSLVLAYETAAESQISAVELLLGSIKAEGKLPVLVNKHFPRGAGIELQKIIRLKYTLPEEVGLSSEQLHQSIDTIVQIGLDAAAYPGCQVLVAIDNKVIFNKAYGYQSYQKKQKVSLNDYYDLASVTKITGPLLPLMKLYEEGKINLNKSLTLEKNDMKYLGWFKKANKHNLIWKEVLSHQAGLKPYIRFYENIVDSSTHQYNLEYLSLTQQGDFTLKVGDSLFLNENYLENMYHQIYATKIKKKPDYLYSGLPFLLFPDIITKKYQQPYEQYLTNTFYKSIGAKVVYNPLEKGIPLLHIVPTEDSTLLRRKLIRGYVHDEAAAMFGGVSGNAGLFSNTNELVKIYQMLLNRGSYGGIEYLSPNTISTFTQRHYEHKNNRRGLGYDKPSLPNAKEPYPSKKISQKSFGHTGFTGTMVWVDPETKLIFIFLSNRVHPTRENRKLYEMNIRGDLLDSIISQLK